MAAPQAFYTYEQLGRMWQVEPGTVSKWTTELRHRQPADVWITYRRVKGHRRTAHLAASTVRILQDLHFPKGEHPRGLASERTMRPSPYRANLQTRRLGQAQAAPAPPSPAMRRLALPPMPSRDDRVGGGGPARAVESA